MNGGPPRPDPTAPGAAEAADALDHAPSSDEAAGPPPTADAAAARRPRRRRRLGVAAAVLVVAVLGAGAAVVLATDDDPPADGADDGTAGDDAPGTTTTTEPELTAQRAFPLAARRLDEAGSFSFRGTAEADAPSVARPGPWLPGPLAVEGDVALPDRLHELAVDPSGQAAETLVVGLTVWGRTAPGRDGVGARDYATIAELTDQPSGPSGAALVPAWLAATVDRTDGGPDALGRRTFRATVPAAAVGDDTAEQPAADASVTLAVDDAGQPVHVEVTGGPGGPLLHVAVDIERIGTAVAIAPPGEALTAVTGDVTRQQAIDAGIAEPVALTRVPRGWVLYATALEADSPRAGCSTLQLDYQRADARFALDDYIGLRITAPSCPTYDERFADPFRAGPYTGTVDADRDGALGQVTDGRTVVVFATSLSAEDATTLLASLGPFDPGVQPEPLDGVPS